MARHEVFERRAVVYRQADAKLRSRTRFFAAAGLVNAVLGELFRLAPAHAMRDAYRLLSEAGAALEAANLGWSRTLCANGPVDFNVDQLLVRGEQRLLQSFLVSYGDRRHPTPIDELNRLLNARHWSVLGARCFGHGRRFLGILEGVRTGIGHCFDFRLESHRIELGLAIVRDVRRRDPR